MRQNTQADAEAYIRKIVGTRKIGERVACRERSDLEYKESFNLSSWAQYGKTMAAFANNSGGYLLFGIKDKPREIKGVNPGFDNFKQEKFTEALNSQFSPEIEWETGMVQFDGFSIGYIYTTETEHKPVIALKNESSEKINSGDVFYRYRARTEKIKYPEMNSIIEDRAKQERESILKLIEVIRKSGTAELGIVNYSNGHFSTPYGTDVLVDRKLITKVLKKARYIKEGSFDEKNGAPVIRVTGNIDLAEEVPVPDIEPDVQYPYLQKHLAEKLGISNQKLYALIWKYQMKGQKKFHIPISSSGTSKIHKFSDVALQYLADKINENKGNGLWLDEIYQEYLQSRRGGKNNG